MLLRVLGVLGKQQSGTLSPDRFQFASHCMSASLASDAVGFVYRQSDCCFHCQSQCAVGRVQSSWSCSWGSEPARHAAWEGSEAPARSREPAAQESVPGSRSLSNF